MTISPQARDDQAAGLRSLMGRQAPRRVAVVTPGEADGGRVLRPLALALARQRRQVWLVEAAAPTRVFSVLPDGGFAPIPHGHQPYASLSGLTALTASPPHCVLVQTAATQLPPLAVGAQVTLVVVPGNDPTGAALTAAYASIKSLHAHHAMRNFRILPMACTDAAAAQDVFHRLATVAARYLTVTLGYAGDLPAHDVAPLVRENAYVRVAQGWDDWFR